MDGRLNPEIHAFDDDKRDILASLQIETHDQGMIVYAVAVSKDWLNQSLSIPLSMGDSISGEVYDTVHDQYIVYGVEYHEIGYIPVGCRVNIAGDSSWQVDMPLPFAVIHRHMSAEQQQSFENWKKKYPEEEYEIRFLQSVSVY